jgi:hypothetical protein
MEAPKSPWRYPHLNFRDSRKNKGKFRNNKGGAAADNPRLAFMRRTGA